LMIAPGCIMMFPGIRFYERKIHEAFNKICDDGVERDGGGGRGTGESPQKPQF
jgi:hypothetical protein